MSRMRAVAADVAREALVQAGWKEIDPTTKKPTGRVAADLSEAELLRMDGRVKRWYWRGPALSAFELTQLAARRRRARQTHPGKRGRA